MKNSIGSKTFKQWASGQTNNQNALKALEKRPHMPPEPKLGLPKNKGVIRLLDMQKKLAPFAVWGMHEQTKQPPKKYKPYKGQSNIDNQIAALAGQPTGAKSSISTGESV